MIDAQHLARGLAGPNTDTRTWLTHGLVDGNADLESEDCCVDFSGAYPLVRVMTQPDLVPVMCRVLSMHAGNGEGEWVPFLPGDEVAVALPYGNSRAGAWILGKLNNDIDVWPGTSVAGQDPKQNNFSFRRARTPIVNENAGPILMRDARTGAVISSDDTGALTFRSGNPTDPTAPAPAQKIAADVMGWQDAKGEAVLQLNLTDRTFNLRMDDAVLTLCSGDSTVQQNMLTVASSFALGTIGNPPIEHVATTEAVFNIVIQTLLAFATAQPGLLTGAALTTFLGIPYAATIPLIAVAPLLPQFTSAIQLAFASALPKPNTPTGQVAPGIGCPGFLVG